MSRQLRSLVVYDSLYGNTERVARRIAEVIGGRVVAVTKVDDRDLEELDLLIVGSPVHGGRPTPAIELFLDQLLPESLVGVGIAAFDTRFATEDHGLGLRILMNVIRFAAEHIESVLIKKGGVLVIKSEGFIVKDKQGPLEDGEIGRVTLWARDILEVLSRGGGKK